MLSRNSPTLINPSSLTNNFLLPKIGKINKIFLEFAKKKRKETEKSDFRLTAQNQWTKAKVEEDMQVANKKSCSEWLDYVQHEHRESF